MNCSMNENRPMVAILTAAVAHSPIVAPRRLAHLPAGFDDVDAAILDWIASEGHRIGRSFALM